MTDIILCGCNGKMGQVISRCVAERDDCRIVAGIDITGVQKNNYPVFSSPDALSANGDVVIDFSHPSVLTSLLAMAKEKKLPASLFSNC